MNDCIYDGDHALHDCADAIGDGSYEIRRVDEYMKTHQIVRVTDGAVIGKYWSLGRAKAALEQLRRLP